MIGSITSMLSKERTLHAEVALDHIELFDEHIIMGLRLTWHNNTSEAIEIWKVLIKLFLQGEEKCPFELTYNGRFVQIPYQKTIAKIGGAPSLHIEAGSTQVVGLRFISRDVLDLDEGNYCAELYSVVPDGTYLHNFDLQIASHLKSRPFEPKSETVSLGTSTSSIYSRALRIGLNP